MKFTLLMLLFASSIVSSKSQLHQYTKDSRLLRTSHHSPQQPTSKNDNFQSAHYGNKEDDGQQSSYYFTPKKAITSSTQSQVNLFSSNFYFTIQSWFNVESVGIFRRFTVATLTPIIRGVTQLILHFLICPIPKIDYWKVCVSKWNGNTKTKTSLNSGGIQLVRISASLDWKHMLFLDCFQL